MTLSIPRVSDRLFLLVLSIFLLVFARGVHAQEIAGTVQGSVVDQRGQAIQGATITVESDNQIVRSALSGADGKFSIAGLSAGTYTVQVASTGFGTEEKTVEVAAGASATLSFSLNIASVAEEVTVEAEGDHVDGYATGDGEAAA